MRAKHSLLLVLFILLSVVGYTEDSVNNDIKNTIKILMTKSGYLDEFMDEMKILYKNPKFAVELLIQELHVVNDKRYDGGSIEEPKSKPDTYHVIVCIRSLRHLTGKNFFAPTKRKITDERRRGHLYLDDETERVIPFFMTHMSTCMVFIAPKDAQQSIINQWKEWYKKEGQTYDYEKNRIDITDVGKYLR
ncbi:MAG: hypothetical protein A2017_08485 [Lentisphaerae bacterium GWF2_44_16]|nr:MAG: hypothetical protein A2017_08485 [Lentisphaerae bacterium GWF2_44_16]